MITWIIANLGTILISFVLILVVVGIIALIVKDKKQGKSTCGGNCAHCKMCTSCRHSEPAQTGKQHAWKKIS